VALQIGDLRRVTHTFVNTAGVGTNPTAVVLHLTAPNGTHTHPTPVSSGAGVYYYDVPITLEGVWAYGFTGTGAVVSAEQGEFYVNRAPVLTAAVT